MSHSRTQTVTTTPSSTPYPSRGDLEEDKEEIIRWAEEKVRRVKERKAAANKKAEEEAAQKAAEEAQKQKEAAKRELEERRRKLAEAATARGDPDDGGDGEDDNDNEDEQAPCKRCRSKKIPCQMQAGKRSSIICKPYPDAKVRCSYSGRPSTVKREGGANPSGECLVVLESQVAQLLADNQQLRDGQVKANTYHRHFNRKLDWLIMDAARRRRSPPELQEAGPSGTSKKRRRVVDSDEEEEKEIEGEMEKVREEVEEEEEENELAPKKAWSEKGKEREE
ncbi:hypothetical protein LENED_010343 [Lentinula edodes]|uniref:Uncharacterized protein n=1 Tax=Lentinula edodes TaxID=5353 RepID=A0A1Q3EM58_LENED|nr:hypothetical protein LENED_010343 [Lentinula edodes]